MIFAAPVAHSEQATVSMPDLNHIIGTLEHLRGFEKTGFSFTSEVVGLEDKKEHGRHQMAVKVSPEGFAVVEIETPETEKGRRTLVREKDMWLFLPSSINVMRIAPLQKVFGDASTADILNTSYSQDYEVGDYKAGDEKDVLMLTFKAKNASSTYGTIEVAFDQAADVPKYSRHFTASGRLLKTVNYHTFATYENEKKIEKISIQDDLKKNYVIWIKLSNYKKGSFPEHIFTKAGFTKS